MNDQLTALKEIILNQQAKLAVIGLGYVGLPVACMFADKGFQVIGVDVKADRVEQINNGQCPIEGYEPGLPELLSSVVAIGKLKATTDYDLLQDVDVILIDVETPTDDQHIPQYVALRSACHSLAGVLKKGALVIVESTIAPGTMEKIVRPILEETSGKKSNAGFYLGVCPERVMPGKLLENLQKMSRVCGAETSEVSEVLQMLYRNIVHADLDPSDLITAELTKTAENAYRDVNIAFANELALICQSMGSDFLRVRELVNKSPGRNVLLAGAGVGGHCIPKDPWLLVYGARGKADVRLIPAARLVNDSMPLHVADLLTEALMEADLTIQGARVAILGYAYLEESDDTRNSPSKVLETELLIRGADVIVHDPFVKEYQADIYQTLSGCDAAVFMVAHQVYKQLEIQKIKAVLRTPILIDGRFIFEWEDVQQAGFVFRGVGQGFYNTHELTGQI